LGYSASRTCDECHSRRGTGAVRAWAVWHHRHLVAAPLPATRRPRWLPLAGVGDELLEQLLNAPERRGQPLVDGRRAALGGAQLVVATLQHAHAVTLFGDVAAEQLTGLDVDGGVGPHRREDV